MITSLSLPLWMHNFALHLCWAFICCKITKLCQFSHVSARDVIRILDRKSCHLQICFSHEVGEIVADDNLAKFIECDFNEMAHHK